MITHRGPCIVCPRGRRRTTSTADDLRETTMPTTIRRVAVTAAIASLSITACSSSNDALLVTTTATAAAPAAGDAATTTTAPAAAPAAFAVGDRIALGDWELVVHSVTDAYTDDSGVINPAEGSRFVHIDAEVFYTGTEPQVISTGLCFGVQDAENRAYMTTFYPSPAGLLDGDIGPAGARRGGMIFEVPAAAAGLRLNFKCDLTSTGSATVNLGV
jgi:hypothetical protein